MVSENTPPALQDPPGKDESSCDPVSPRSREVGIGLNEAEQEEAKALIQRGLNEDVPAGDVTSEYLIPQDITIRANFIPRSDGILCGLPVAAQLFREIEPAILMRPLKSEGDRIKAGQSFLEIEGPVQAILKGERLALNFLQLLSGIASLTRIYVEAIEKTDCKLYDTRKTTPGWRFLQKYAVRVGGGQNHRRSLSEFALIKDNHRQVLRSLGETEISSWIKKIREKQNQVLVELEVDQLDELEEALKSELDIVLLDNFSIEGLKKAVELVREFKGHKPLLEASGGIDLTNIQEVAETGVDRIAVGAITHSAKALDIGLDLFEIVDG